MPESSDTQCYNEDSFCVLIQVWGAGKHKYSLGLNPVSSNTNLWGIVSPLAWF